MCHHDFTSTQPSHMKFFEAQANHFERITGKLKLISHCTGVFDFIGCQRRRLASIQNVWS
jgi:hypothetical protein